MFALHLISQIKKEILILMIQGTEIALDFLFQYPRLSFFKKKVAFDVGECKKSITVLDSSISL
jgi:hypothetical protein